MNRFNSSLFIVLVFVFGIIFTSSVLVPVSVMSQWQVPAELTATEEPKPPTEEPTKPPTEEPVTPIPSEPVSIPEPITVVLFGTGLAALSAAAAARRKKD